jgi:putative membrane protein
MEKDDTQQTSHHLANEQTYLAWLRTGVEVMAFGFVAIKFSLFTSQVMGIILVGWGALMTLLAYLRYRSTLNQLRKGSFRYDPILLTVTAAAIFIISTILIFFLISAYFGSPQQEQHKEEKLFRLKP